MKRCLAVCAAALLLPGAFADTSWFKEIHLRADADNEGKREFTVRLRPNESHICEAIEFESFYHQEFPWEDARGKKYTKIHEPVSFVYRRGETKLVNDLDAYVSFRVPIARAELDAKYGLKTFNKDYPVTITRIKITGVSGGKAVWTYTIPVGAKLDMQALDQQSVPPVEVEEAEVLPVVR